MKRIFTNFITIILLLAGLFLPYSCRKASLGTTYTDPYPATEALRARFYSVPAGAPATINKVVRGLQIQEKQYGFLSYFIAKNGWPKWSNAEMQGGMAIVPFVKEGENEVNGFFIAKPDADSSYRFSLFRKDLYALYGFTDSLSGISVDRVQLIINHFNKAIYNIEIYKLYDRRQLPPEALRIFGSNVSLSNLTGRFSSHAGKAANTKPYLQPAFAKGSDGDGGTPNVIECINYTECTDWWYSPNGTNENDADAYYAYTTCSTSSVCSDFESFPPPGGEGGGNGVEWWTGGGGGGGSTPDPCAEA